MKSKFRYQGVIVFIIALSFLLSGCSNKLARVTEVFQKPPKVDELAEDSQYHYYNNELGIKIDFPEEFIYYQVQRIEAEDFIDLEFLVPTTDSSYPSDVPNFAKPIVIRIFDKDYWENNHEEYDVIYQKLAERGNKIYTIRIWQNIPRDWQAKWNSEMMYKILDSFELK